MYGILNYIYHRFQPFMYVNIPISSNIWDIWALLLCYLWPPQEVIGKLGADFFLLGFGSISERTVHFRLVIYNIYDTDRSYDLVAHECSSLTKHSLTSRISFKSENPSRWETMKGDNDAKDPFVCPKNPGFPLSNPMVGLKFLENQSYTRLGGVRIVVFLGAGWLEKGLYIRLEVKKNR